MAQLYDLLKPQKTYWDKKNFNSVEAYNNALATSATVYVGNLSFYTQQNSIKQLFSRAGNVKDIIMGIDNDGNPCGFCFVVYQTRSQAELAVQYISKTRLGGRIIRVDWDPGYMEGRQKGRGMSGQQRRDDFRNKEDPQRPRKKVVTNDQYGSNRSQSYHKGGDNHRQNDRRGDQRRDYRNRDQRNDRGQRQYRGDRDNRRQNDYNRRDRGQQRQQRDQRQSSRPPRQQPKQTKQADQQEY